MTPACKHVAMATTIPMRAHTTRRLWHHHHYHTLASSLCRPCRGGECPQLQPASQDLQTYKEEKEENKAIYRKAKGVLQSWTVFNLKEKRFYRTMGADSSRDLDPEMVDKMQQSTSFTGPEIKEWYKRFKEQCPDGEMTREQFQEMYARLFRKGDASSFADHIFRAYDADKSGKIDFQEFLCTMSVSCKGSIDEKLRWAFTLYDLDGNGYVSRKEAKEIIKGIYRMRGISERGDERGHPSPDDTVNAIFNQLDKDSDGKLTDMEFILGAKSCPQVLSILQNFN